MMENCNNALLTKTPSAEGEGEGIEEEKEISVCINEDEEERVSCCNCNSILVKGDSGMTSHFHDFINCSIYNALTKRSEDCTVRISDAVEKIFNILGNAECKKSYYSDVLKKPELFVCSSCVEKLFKLYQLYNEFIALALQSNSILAKIVASCLPEPEAEKVENPIVPSEPPKGGVDNGQNGVQFAKIIKNGKGQTMLKRHSKSKCEQKGANVEKLKSTRQRKTQKHSNKPSKHLNSSSEEKELHLKQTLNGENDKSLRHDANESFECGRCQKVFKTCNGLKIHLAAHVRDDNKFECKECGKKFRKLETAQLHIRTEHMGYKPHKCPHEGCDRSFRLKEKLKLHIKVIHEKNKPFPCPKCDKSFRTRYHLKVHDVSQHVQGDNSIGCSQCKRKFSSREALDAHIQTHESEKPFVCSKCNKGFQTLSRLKLHSKSHEVIPTCICPVCGRHYKHPRDLRLHEVVHQDESTFRFGCTDCGKRFYRRDLLKVHMHNSKHFSGEIVGPSMLQARRKTEQKFNKKKKITDSVSHDNLSDPLLKEVKRRHKKVNGVHSPLKGSKKQGNKSDVKTNSAMPNKRFQDSMSRNDLSTTSSVTPVHLSVLTQPSTSETGTFLTLEKVEISELNSLGNLHTKDLDLSSSLDTAANDVESVVALQRQTNQQSNNTNGIPVQLLHAPIIQNLTDADGSFLRDSMDRQFYTFSIAAGAEQIGFDVINAFINSDMS